MRRIRVVIVLGALALLLTVPSSLPSPPPSSEAPSEPSSVRPWAHEAVAWLEARNEAAALGIANLLRFMAPDVVYDDSAPGPPLVGRAQYGALLQAEELETGAELRTDLVYLDAGGAVVISAGLSRTVVTLDVGTDGRTTAEGSTETAGGYMAVLAPAVAARSVARDYEVGWSSPDPWVVGELYAEDARLQDSVLGLELQGRDAIESFAGSIGSAERRVTLGHQYESDDVELREGQNLEVIAFLTAAVRAGCTGRMAVSLTTREGRIIEERRYHEIRSVRRCWDTGDLPAGWWTGLEPMPPYDDVVTGTVRVGTQRIEIHNGDAGLERLVEWAMGRYASAGLVMPVVDSITFAAGENPVQCQGEANGLTIDLGDTAQVFVCLDHAAVCVDERCTEFRTLARLLVVHELAHAWIDEQLDPAARGDFMERFELEVWSSPDVDWHHRGAEQAAQVIAWGLMDRPTMLPGMDDRSCAELDGAFQLLTGTSAIGPCPG